MAVYERKLKREDSAGDASAQFPPLADRGIERDGQPLGPSGFRKRCVIVS
jgi:hypothetical protein